MIKLEDKVIRQSEALKERQAKIEDFDASRHSAGVLA
jgi:hypothetical protein